MPSPTVPDTAWPVTEMPQPANAGFGGAFPRDAVVGGPGFVAVGSISPCCADASFDDEPWLAVIWTSADGSGWELVEDLASFGKAALVGIAARDGTMVAVGYEVLPPAGDDPLGALFTQRGTAWQSTNGIDWTPVAGLDGGATFSDVAAAPWGWVVAGSVDGTPVAWTSADLRTWRMHRFEGRSLDQDRLAVDSTGRVASIGCVVDERLLGDCTVVTRVTDSGDAWATGVIEGPMQLGAVTAADDQFVVVGPDPSSSIRAWASTDGLAWTSRGTLDASASAMSAASANGVLVVVGDRIVGGEGEPAAWTCRGGSAWEEGPVLAPVTAAGFGQARVIVAGQDQVIVLGNAFVDGGGRPFAWVGMP